MISKSFKEISRYLQALGKLIKTESNTYIYTDRYGIIAHLKDSIFDQIPVLVSVIEDKISDVWLYGVSHNDGIIYVQTLKNIRNFAKSDKVNDCYLYDKSKFVDIKKIEPNQWANKFIHLHNHQQYSSLDGIGKAEDYARRAKQLDIPVLAITDHGNMAGIIEFYKACKNYGIKPIIGQEFYLDEKMSEKGLPDDFKKSIKKEKNKKEITKLYEKEHRINLRRHLCLFAKNDEGLHNLYKLSSIAYSEGFYYRPRIDWDVLQRHSSGIVASTACMGGILCAETDIKQRLDNLRKLVKIFGRDNLFLETMLIEYEQQPNCNDMIFELSEKYNIPAILTVDAHFVDPDVDHLHHIYMKIGSGFTYGEGDNYLKIYPELKATYHKLYSKCKYGWQYYEKAIQNNFKLADLCNVELELGKFRLPSVDLKTMKDYKENDTETIYFKRRIMQGWKEKITNIISVDKQEIYKKQLIHEIDVIINAGYVGYMLIVLDAIDWCHQNNIMDNVRGSAAASIVCYLLGITRVDSIKRELLFERFISAARTGDIDTSYKSFPDIDLDVTHRDLLIKYFENKYGKDRVARIGTYNRMQIRQAIKEIAIVTEFMTKEEANKLTTKLPNQATDLEKALEIEEFKKWYNLEKNKEWFDKYVEPLLDTVGHGGIHASGIVITPGPLSDYMPIKVQERKKEEDYDEDEKRLTVTQFDGDAVEAIGFLKLDILTVTTLESLSESKKLIEQRHNRIFEFDKIDIDNPKIYDGFVNGDTMGIFQLDTPVSTRLVKESKPTNFFELMVTIALSRPGTAGPGLDMEYCLRKKGKPFEYDHPLLKPILNNTFSIPCFQEQIMKIVHIIGGLTLIEADKLRTVMKKKDHKEMASYQERFIKGALERGCKDRNDAMSIWNKISSWSKYGFNSAHSASYSQVSAWCMVLKKYFPLEFYMGVLFAYSDDKDYLKLVYKDLKKHNIAVCLPNVNKGKNEFYINDNEIVWALSSCKYVGEIDAKKIGECGPYKSIADLLEKTEKVDGKKINKRCMDALICVGAFKDIYIYPKNAAIDYYVHCRKESLPSQFDIEDNKYWESVFMRYMGFYSVDPMITYADTLKPYGKIDSYEEFSTIECLQDVKIAGFITFIKKIESKRGPMCILRLEVEGEDVSIVAWNSFYSKHQISQMDSDDLMGKFCYVFGQKDLDPQGKVQVQLSDVKEEKLEFLN